MITSQQKRVVKGVSEADASLGAAVKNVSKGMPALQPAPVKKQALKHQRDDDDDDDDAQGYYKPSSHSLCSPS